jgi:hypothetical protein
MTAEGQESLAVLDCFLTASVCFIPTAAERQRFWPVELA